MKILSYKLKIFSNILSVIEDNLYYFNHCFNVETFNYISMKFYTSIECKFVSLLKPARNFIF